ncbi:LamG domain-containing protein [Longispora sp. NPDC051575]|uniref:LamG domain-containing protein n=1 Tax=Longispora sp. NPDC051575 TaxID=3154943 RepID=UPI00342DB7F9
MLKKAGCAAAVGLAIASICVPADADDHGVTVARYDFGSTGSSDMAEDLSGHGHTLRAVATRGGELTVTRDGRLTALQFPAVCEVDDDCPRVVLQAPSVDDLNPGTRDLRFGVTLRMQPSQTSKGSNVLQKGWSVTGAQYKLQVDGYEGRPSCVLVGEDPTIWALLGPRSVADGTWHSVDCARRGGDLTVTVDGSQVASSRVPANLSIDTDQPLRFGGKGPGARNDQFFGDLANAYVIIDRP